MLLHLTNDTHLVLQYGYDWPCLAIVAFRLNKTKSASSPNSKIWFLSEEQKPTGGKQNQSNKESAFKYVVMVCNLASSDSWFHSISPCFVFKPLDLFDIGQNMQTGQ